MQRRIAFGVGGHRNQAGSSARASVSRAPGRAPRSAAAGVTAWMSWPWVPSTVRTTGASGATIARSSPSARSPAPATRWKRSASYASSSGLADPAGAEQFGVPRRRPGARGSSALSKRLRARDPPAHPRAAQVRAAAQPHQPARRAARSAATASRRVAVKSSARGSPQISPITADRHGASYALLHRPQRIARVARLDMDEVSGRKPGRMDLPAFEDRHAVLDPQQGLAGHDLRQQEPRPAAVARVRGEQLGKGWAGGRGQTAMRSPSPLGAGGFSAQGELRTLRRRPGTRSPATQLTTFLFYFCSFSRNSGQESMAQLRNAAQAVRRPGGRAASGCARGPPSVSSEHGFPQRLAQHRPVHRKADMVGVDLNRACRRSSSRPRAALGATIPSRRDQKASVGTGGFSGMRGTAARSTSWPATRSYNSRTLVLVL